MILIASWYPDCLPWVTDHTMENGIDELIDTEYEYLGCSTATVIYVGY
jgi:hypothetical protein